MASPAQKNRIARGKKNPWKSQAFSGVTVTLGAESGGNVRRATIQFTDDQGNAIKERVGCFFYVSDDAEGDNLTGTAVDTIAIGDSTGVYIAGVAGKSGWLISDVNGQVLLDLTQDAVIATYRLIFVMPDGGLVASGAVAFA